MKESKKQQFHDPEEFSFLNDLKDSWREIKDEFLTLEHRLHPWPELYLQQRIDRQTCTIYPETGWDVFGVYAFGKKNLTNCTYCPITTEIIESFPFIPKTVSFSVLQPGAHILPHSGYSGYSTQVFRTHLGLEVPDKNYPLDIDQNQKQWTHNPRSLSGCCLRVEDQVTTWKEGEVLVFDDSLEHEAWNFCNTRRVVLLVDIDRPSLGDKVDYDPLTHNYLEQLTTSWGFS